MQQIRLNFGPILALLILSWADSAEAINNAEWPAASQPPAPWSLVLDQTLQLSDGNVASINVGAAGRLSWQDAATTPNNFSVPGFRNRWRLAGDYNWAKANGRRYSDRGAAHSRYSRMLSPRLSSEIFVQYEYNDFRALQRRAVAGLGASVYSVWRATFKFWQGLAAMPEYERSLNRDCACNLDTWAMRASLYATWAASGKNNLASMQNTTYVQPRFDRFSDLRWSNHSDFEVKWSSRISFGLGFEIEHDRLPPPGIKELDLSLQQKLRIRI